ncbi:hypothetical protein OIDMADRAFT_183625 [Oidiodendron maius Zn]|uniref:Uncharacterized protein n=1 Tax=Oidiodendron maius (strain Zn) TaxID=913774 RepID=A0A0C3GZ68_OIDMZ|nr:hypothetical protein OIDMADRAFT_183625 [Oidiodendron maius Zn]
MALVADNETQQELSLDAIRSQRGENPIYVTNEYHDFHCVYTWKALHRAVIRHSLIDTHIGNFTHTKHCSRSLEAAWRRKSKMSTFYPIYATCMDPNALDIEAIHGLEESGTGT